MIYSTVFIMLLCTCARLSETCRPDDSGNYNAAIFFSPRRRIARSCCAKIEKLPYFLTLATIIQAVLDGRWFAALFDV